jgi:hypothetical protein
MKYNKKYNDEQFYMANKNHRSYTFVGDGYNIFKYDGYDFSNILFEPLNTPTKNIKPHMSHQSHPIQTLQEILK